MSSAGAHLVGAATYASWAGFWPSAPGPFAKPMNDILKLVFSNSLKSADWAGTTIVAGERLFTAPLTLEPISTTAFSSGAAAHVFTAHP